MSLRRRRRVLRCRPAVEEALRDGGKIVSQNGVIGKTEIVGHQFVAAAMFELHIEECAVEARITGNTMYEYRRIGSGCRLCG